MATQIQWRRGNTAQTAAFTGVVAEVTVDTDKKTLVVHDGTTAGGTPLAKEGTLSTSYNHANGAFDKANSANVLAQSAFDKANQTAQLAFTTVSANGTSLTADANNDTLTITSAVANGVFVTGVSGTDTLDIGLIDSGVTASGYGDSISVPTFVVDAKGRLTSASNTSIRSGTTSQTGIVRLEDSVTSTSTSNAATPASVKTAYDLATTANVNAVNAGTYANAAFDKANTATTTAQAGFDKANTATTTAGLAYNHANGAFDKANTATTTAQAGFDKANTATTTAGLAYNHANGAFDKANTATTTADAAFAKANSANVIAQAAFDNSNTKFASAGGSITGDVSVTGNLTVVGQTIYANTTTALIADNLLTLNAAINQASAPVSDAGIEVDRGSSANVSILWNESTDKWTYTNDGTTYYNIADSGRLDSSFNHANGAFDKANTATTTSGLAYNHANGAFDKANTVATTAQNAYDLANGTAGIANTDYTTISATAGVYGNASYVPVTTLTANGRVSLITNTAIAIDTSAITSGTLADARLPTKGVAGTYGNNSYHPVITTDAYGRVTGVTNTIIQISTTQITSGVLPFAQGGANATSYTTGQFLTSNGTALVSVANTGTAGTYANATYVPVITTDDYGRVTAITNTAISFPVTSVVGTTGVISNTQILSGLLTVDGAGSGLDADLLDGLNSASFANAAFANTDYTTISATAGVYGNASYVPVSTLTANGRISSITNTAIAIDTSQITSGTIADARLPSVVSAGTFGNSTTAITLTVDAKGRITSISQTAITITESDPSALAFAIALG